MARNLRRQVKESKRVYAKQLRNHPTKAESVFWEAVKSRNYGYKFRRQVIMRGYIVDFYCPELQLIVEVDGSVHELRVEQDAYRTQVLNGLGFDVMRFTNEQVIGDFPSVWKVIRDRYGDRKL